MNGTKIARLLLRIVFVSLVSMSSGVIGASAAAADPCPVLDLGCVLDETTTTVEEVLEETTTTVGGVLEDTTTVVEEVLEDTTTAIGDTVEDTLPIDTGGVVPEVDVPGGVLPGGGGGLPGEGALPPGEGALPPETQIPGDGGTEPGTDTEVGPPASGAQPLPTGGVATSDPVGASSTVVVTTPSETGDRPTERDNDPGAGILSGARLVGIIAFPLVLILMVAVFLIVQDRIDRKDPKLTLAPVGSEYLTFS